MTIDRLGENGHLKEQKFRVRIELRKVRFNRDITELVKPAILHIHSGNVFNPVTQNEQKLVKFTDLNDKSCERSPP